MGKNTPIICQFTQRCKTTLTVELARWEGLLGLFTEEQAPALEVIEV